MNLARFKLQADSRAFRGLAIACAFATIGCAAPAEETSA
jgi:hypothetical protein